MAYNLTGIENVSSPQPALHLLRFGLFELDLDVGELRKENRRIKLQEQPFQVLVLLLRHPGEVVTREKLKQALWPADTFVEFDQGLNTAIKKIRLALGDSADNPRFLETIPRKGYRFIAPVNSNTFPATALPLAQPRGRSFLWVAALFGLVISIGIGVWSLQRKQISKPSPVPIPLTSYPGDESSPSFSPDGNYVAFAWNNSDKFREGNFDIFIKTINGGDPIRITQDSANEISPAWSPDGRSIAFLRALPNGVSGVFLVPAIGGPERKLAELYGLGESCYEAFLSWFPDNKSLAVLDRESPDAPTAVFRLSLETGEKQRLTSPPRASWGDWDPAVSPDGHALAFRRSLEENSADLFLLDLSESSGSASETRRLTFEKNAFNPAWTPDGRAIIFSAGPAHALSLWELTLSGPGRRPGKLERLAYAGNGAVTPGISRQGRLAYAQGSLVACRGEFFSMLLCGGGCRNSAS